MVRGPSQVAAIRHYNGFAPFQAHSVKHLGSTCCAVASVTAIENAVRVPWSSVLPEVTCTRPEPAALMRHIL